MTAAGAGDTYMVTCRTHRSATLAADTHVPEATPKPTTKQNPTNSPQALPTHNPQTPPTSHNYLLPTIPASGTPPSHANPPKCRQGDIPPRPQMSPRLDSAVVPCDTHGSGLQANVVRQAPTSWSFAAQPAEQNGTGPILKPRPPPPFFPAPFRFFCSRSFSVWYLLSGVPRYIKTGIA